MSGQPLAQRGRHVAREAHGTGHAQLATGLIACRGELGPRLGSGLGHRRALLVEALAGVGKPQLARGAHEQGDAARGFELAYLLAHRGGAHAQGAARCTHRSLFDHGGEDSHAFEVIHELIMKLYFKVLVKKVI